MIWTPPNRKTEQHHERAMEAQRKRQARIDNALRKGLVALLIVVSVLLAWWQTTMPPY